MAEADGLSTRKMQVHLAVSHCTISSQLIALLLRVLGNVVMLCIGRNYHRSYSLSYACAKFAVSYLALLDF